MSQQLTPTVTHETRRPSPTGSPEEFYLPFIYEGKFFSRGVAIAAPVCNESR